MNKSLRGKYWFCKNCREWVPDETDTCDCGFYRYRDYKKKVPPVIPYKNADSRLARLLKTDQMDFQSKTIDESIHHIQERQWGH